MRPLCSVLRTMLPYLNTPRIARLKTMQAARMALRELSGTVLFSSFCALSNARPLAYVASVLTAINPAYFTFHAM